MKDERTYAQNKNYNRREIRISLGMNLSLKKSSKCTIHVNVYKLYAVHHNNTVWSLDISVTISSFYKVYAEMN